MSKKIRVLIVDDSAFMRHLLKEILNGDPSIEVVDTASDPLIARTKIKALNPDVLTLDIQMPNMNGLDFLEKLMALRPIPVVMISSLTESGANETIKALELGAVDYVTKPHKDLEHEMGRISEEICSKVKIASKAKLRGSLISRYAPASETDQKILTPKGPLNVRNKYIAIGASTGGVEALFEVICSLPEGCPPIVIVQHMPEKFTASFAQRLDRYSKLTVHEAMSDMKLEAGHVYLAPGGKHFAIKKAGPHYVTHVFDDQALVSGHRPSVDVLFESMAQHVGNQTIAFLMTGMGKDGAQGLKKLKDAGAMTYGQNEASCVVYGMSRAAKEINAVTKEIHLNQIATTIVGSCS